MIEEAQRVSENVRAEAAPAVWVEVACRSTDAERGVDRVRAVMEIVAQQRAEDWKEDVWWEAHLPRWFIESFGEKTLDEVMNDPEAWDFGSWLDAMKDPGWTWWSSGSTEDGWVVNLSALSDPYSLGALEYLCREAGAQGMMIRER